MSVRVVTADTWRISVLTSALVRLEVSPSGRFEDRQTQVVVDRDLGGPGQVQVTEDEGVLEIVTDDLHLVSDRREFTPEGLRVQVRGNISNYHSVWRYGEQVVTLGGTTRTLDMVDGRAPLGPGVLSHNGLAVLDDSRSLVVEDGVPQPREAGAVDLYVFAHGRDYRRAIDDFYALTGPVPLIPRFVLGNWWSRYHPYTTQEYLTLIERMRAHGIPLSVAVLDMDWHITDVDPTHGSGWTGYTWNRDLVPDPAGLLAALHERGLVVTLNDHPADGVRAHEEAYPRMARALGIDPDSEVPVQFEASDRDYLQALSEHVLRPLEEQGVDFWWIDWQQGEISRVPGLDPLRVLNETYTRDMEVRGRRPVVLSRYAGPGSHRTPVGFSGDTVVSWASLHFQPEFTATASNIGYGWWSHDIGGHLQGVRDDELQVRWVQLGVLSPVNRLHSTHSPFGSKEPWGYGAQAEQVMTQWLRLRHRLVPYLYTMAERASSAGRPLVQPLYWEHPWQEEAYRYPNEFAYGTELLAAPVTSPAALASGCARVDLWLPDGDWYDVQTGWRYRGGRELSVYRDLAHTALFAPAGAVVPLDAAEVPENGTTNPRALEVLCFTGAEGSFELYEDDGEPVSRLAEQRTPITLERDRVVVGPATGEEHVGPATRDWTLTLVGIPVTSAVSVVVDGEAVESTTEQDEQRRALRVRATDVPSGAVLEVSFEPSRAPNPVSETVEDVLLRAQMPFGQKERAWAMLERAHSFAEGMASLAVLDLPADVLGRLTELVTASPEP